MNKLLLLTGDLATGKSAFSAILSKRYDVNVFKKDSIKEVLGDTIGFTNREENLKLSAVTLELMLFLFSEFTKTLFWSQTFIKPNWKDYMKWLPPITMRCWFYFFAATLIFYIKDI